MTELAFTHWPFFEARHRQVAEAAGAWADDVAPGIDHQDVFATCRRLVRAHGEHGWLRHSVPAAYGGASERLDVRTLCLLRDTFARRDGLLDFSFAMQGLGAGPISLFGSEALRTRYLSRVARGEAVAAFAISEREAGSDISAMRTSARRDGTHFVLEGEKCWISNAGIADHYVVFCAHPELGDRAYSAFVVESDNPGLRVIEQPALVAPHPIGTIALESCRVPEWALVGEAGRGLRVALGTLDVFRSTVGAAALGFGRRALDEAVRWVQQRHAFGKPLAEHQLTQARIADMAVRVDASALLVYRAAWQRDQGAERITREAAMAKLYATESAQQTVDDAVQLLGGRGVLEGEPVERLYREVRSLRIYEGTSEIQKLVVAGQVLSGTGD